MSLVGPVAGGWQVARHFCKSYDCSRCVRRKYRQAHDNISTHCETQGLTRFVTLTLDPKKLPKGKRNGVQAIRYMNDVWRKFRIGMQREVGRRVPYVRVIELHPGKGENRGLPHLHILFNQAMTVDLTPSVYERLWSAAGGGQKVHVTAAKDIHKVRNYLSKYITKTNQLSVPPKVRRFALSRGLVLWPRRKNSGWRMIAKHIEAIHGAMNRQYAAGAETWKRMDGELRLCGFTTCDPPNEEQAPTWRPKSNQPKKKAVFNELGQEESFGESFYRRHGVSRKRFDALRAHGERKNLGDAGRKNTSRLGQINMEAADGLPWLQKTDF